MGGGVRHGGAGRNAAEDAVERSDFVEGLDLGTPAAVGLLAGGVVADDGDGFDGGWIEREGVVFVFEEDDALVGDAAGDGLVGGGVDRAGLAGVEGFGGEEDAEVAADLVVEDGDGDFAALDELPYRCIARALQSKARSKSFTSILVCTGSLSIIGFSLLILKVWAVVRSLWIIKAADGHDTGVGSSTISCGSFIKSPKSL